MTQLTDQQRLAVTAWNVSVALSAGAGCGKTFVLTERFLSCLEPGQDGADGPLRLDQLTAITFTERAAREMRQRIRAACTRRLLEAPEDQVDYWLRIIREMDAARISTIHSFCGSLLRAHAVEARLDPRFQVLDQAQAQTLLYELIDRHLRDRLAERDEAVLDLVVQFGLSSLREMVERLLAFRQEIDWPLWRGETAAGLVARWQEFWRTDSLPRVLDKIGRLPAAKTLLDIATGRPSTNPTMGERFATLLERLPSLHQSGDPRSALAVIREAAKVQGGGSKKTWHGEDVYEAFRAAAEQLRKAIDGLDKQLAFDPEAAEPAAEAALRLLAVADGVAQVYAEEKKQLAALDFDDLLIAARELLTGPEREDLRRRLAAQIKLLLVDEFQDTDPLQVELVKALCDGRFTDGRLFFVGDYKQSIYRFRGADPHVFRQLREQIPAEGRLPLSLNFRSQPAVLEFINALFSEEMGPEYEPLRPHRPQVSPTPAVEFLWAVEEEDDQQGGEDAAGTDANTDSSGLPSPQPSPGGRGGDSDQMSPMERLRRREADWIARRIRAMLDSGEKIVWDEKAAEAGTPTARPVRPGDIALLFRALTDIEYYEEALQRYGIDYYLVGGHAFYAQQEIYDVVNLLRAVASPCDVVSLAGVLRSPFFGLLDETLFWLAQHSDGLAAGLFAAASEDIGDQQRQRVAFAAATLTDLRAMKDRVPIAQLIREALDRTGYDAALLAEFLGQRKLANLHKLIDQARSFDQSEIFTLADFITQLSQFVARQPDEPLAATQSESLDAVRLMTIHQSKGLEFPVVIVPDVDRARRGPSGKVAFTRQLGPMARMPDVTSGYELFIQAESDEDLAESVRLFYVATTRAADYLVLSAGLPELGASRGPWTELIYRRFDPLTGSRRVGQISQSVLDASASPPSPTGVRVTTNEPLLLSKSAAKAKRHDLRKLIEQAQQLAADGGGRIPEFLAPVPPDPTARRQFSFSRLSGALHVRKADLGAATSDAEAVPDSAAIDPIGLGTLVHAVLEEIAPRAPGDVAALVKRHAFRHLPDADNDLAEPIDMVRRLLASPRWASLAAAAEIHKELEFLLAWPPGSKEPEGPYLQGFIDCLYRDAAGGWHVIDYKTNRVAPDEVAALAAHYEVQMFVYSLAVERILGRAPEEAVLCFLRPGVEHRFAWDEADRRRLLDVVEQAMRNVAG